MCLGQSDWGQVDLTVILICIPQMAMRLNVYIDMFVICISSFENCLFLQLANLLIELFDFLFKKFKFKFFLYLRYVSYVRCLTIQEFPPVCTLFLYSLNCFSCRTEPLKSRDDFSVVDLISWLIRVPSRKCLLVEYPEVFLLFPLKLWDFWVLCQCLWSFWSWLFVRCKVKSSFILLHMSIHLF